MEKISKEHLQCPTCSQGCMIDANSPVCFQHLTTATKEAFCLAE